MQGQRRSAWPWPVLVAVISAAMVMMAAPGAAQPAGPGPLVLVDFTAASTNDDGTGGDGDLGDVSPLYDAWGAASSADPSEPGPGAARYEKDVARCTAAVRAGNPSYVDVLVENAYPRYVCTFSVTVRNGSPLTAAVSPAVLDADPGLSFAVATPQLPAALAPGASGEAAFSVEVLNSAPQNAVLHAAVTIVVSADLGRILVDKVTIPAGAGQRFAFDPSWAADFTLADQDPPHDSGLLEPGTYSVAEAIPPAPWVLVSAGCVVQGAPAGPAMAPSSIVVGAGETVVCTFLNVDPRSASLTIVKAADPADNTAFAFDGGTLPDFTLRDPSSPVQQFALSPGQYTITEQTAGLGPGWAFDRVECVGAAWSAAGPAVTVNLAADQSALCTFHNRQEQYGRIRVDKVTDPADAAERFRFANSWDADFFLTDASPRYDSGPLEPGRYALGEVDLPEDWVLLSATCRAPGGPVMDPGNITLGAGETVECTFTNRGPETLGPTPSLTIVKVALPADDTVFSFDGGTLWDFTLSDPSASVQEFTELTPGEYTITELAAGLGEDWEFDKVECMAADWSADGRSVTVDLQEGEAAVCTFYNVGGLPYTGAPGWIAPTAAGGLAAMLLGLLILAATRRRREERA